MKKLPKITIETGHLTSKQLSNLSGIILCALADEVNPKYIVHRFMSSGKIVIEAKPSGICA